VVGSTNEAWEAVMARVGLMALFAGALLAAGPAAAYDPNGWMRFGQENRRDSGNYDREFVREWEANPPRGFPTLSADNIEPMRAAIKRYQAVVDGGGWPAVPDRTMELGMTDPAIGLLAQRLALSGDLRDQAPANTFDYGLERAVKRFQASNGLSPTGVVDKRTVAALNVPASARLRQLQLNLNRLLEHARAMPKRYVVVNIPAAQVEAVENDRVVSRHAGVVGKVDRPSPLLRSAIHELNFNPVWTLPPTVIEKDLIPKGADMQRRGQDVLVKYGIDAYDGSGRKLEPGKIDWSSNQPKTLSYRQQPGKENPLGFLKINFHNAHSVYLHDTPSETIFGRNFRAASSGCVRVQGIEQLAAWLLADNGGWSKERIEQVKETGERLDVKVKRPVPLYFVYLTAWVTEDGVVQFRRDLYQKDGLGTVTAAY
jgi:murein L,D-transpeptidase YcbB/YkuD